MSTDASADILAELYETIRSRKGGDPDTSYTAKLFSKGTGHIAKKVGEETAELIVEAARGERDRLASESADLMYHLLVLWADQDITPNDVWKALAARRGTSGLDEKAARGTN